MTRAEPGIAEERLSAHELCVSAALIQIRAHNTGTDYEYPDSQESDYKENLTVYSERLLKERDDGKRRSINDFKSWKRAVVCTLCMLEK